MSNERGPVVNLYKNDQEIVPANTEVLVKHLQKIGLKTNASVFWNMDFARFEIIGTNDIVKIEVDRPDGSLSRCYLCPSQSKDDGHKYVYLQIDTKITPDNPNHGTEVSGIFPVRIVDISSSLHVGHTCFNTLNFNTENGGSIGLKNDGGVDFDQGKF